MNPLCKVAREGKKVFELLQKNGPLTKNELLRRLNTNFTTLNRIMQPLEAGKLIMEAGVGESTGGRKPLLYDLNPKCFYLLGIDISRPYTQLIVTNSQITPLYTKRILMDDSYTPEKTVQAVAELFSEALTKLGLAKEQFLGGGIGTVGPLDRKKGIMLSPKNFAAPGWTMVPICTMLEQALEIPMMLDNGANTAILAETLFGRGKGYSNLAYFNCSTGIRTGVISGGSLVRTINDAEDAFGHMVVDVDGETCHCGKVGCIECYASIYAIVRKYLGAVAQGYSSGIGKSIDTIDYIDICQAAQRQEPLASAIISEAAKVFGTGLANYINLVNPGLVILSGPLIDQSPLYYEVSIQTATAGLYSKAAEEIVFSKGGYFSETAIAVGAAVMVNEYYLV